MKTFFVKIKGDSPLLHHKMTDEALYGLLLPKSKKKKVVEELTPRQIAEKHVYKNKGKFVIPTGYVLGAFQYAAAEYKQTNSKKSYKAIAAGIFSPREEFAELNDHSDKPIKDFEVDIRKGNNFQAGAICVCRPRFDRWQATFTIELDTDLIDSAMALRILEDSGRRSGIGSFRVSKGGPFGKFSVINWEEMKK